MDVDKILHSMFYNRYTDKTQVFSFYKNDDITRRALHVQLVSRIARSIGRALRLNLDLIDAIALGHDIGHTPFGHKGEQYLSELYYQNCGKRFNHNVHSVRALQKINGLNLTLQTLDGILCHCGEKGFLEYRPAEPPTFKQFYARVDQCYTEPDMIDRLRPCTMEGCVVRISDMIAYLGKDRQDAERAGLKMPAARGTLKTNSKIIGKLTCNIVKNSIGQPLIRMDKVVFDEFMRVKKENDTYIYANKIVEEPYLEVVKPMMEKLYPVLLDDYVQNRFDSPIFKYFRLDSRVSTYYRGLPIRQPIDPNDIVVDYIASMTDDYFIDLFAKQFPSDPLIEKIKYIPYFD